MFAELRICFAADDAVLSRLHTDAFDGDRVPISLDDPAGTAWPIVGRRVRRDRLVGFVHPAWDGGSTLPEPRRVTRTSPGQALCSGAMLLPSPL